MIKTPPPADPQAELLKLFLDLWREALQAAKVLRSMRTKTANHGDWSALSDGAAALDELAYNRERRIIQAGGLLFLVQP